MKVIRIDQEVADRKNSLYKNRNWGISNFYNRNYGKAIDYLNQAIELINVNIPLYQENRVQNYILSEKPVFKDMTHSDTISSYQGEKNELLLYLSIAYRKMNIFYPAKEILERLINFALTLGRDIYPSFNQKIVFFPIFIEELLSRA